MIARLAALLRPGLLRLDPETAHNLTLRALRLVPAPHAEADDPRLAVEAFGLLFRNPIGVAAGFDKNAQVPDALLGLGFGFAEVGTLTPLPQAGNPRPRVFRLPADGAVINRYGFNNQGQAAAHARLLGRKARGGIVGVNIGANKTAVDRGGDYVACIEAFADVASYVTVNVSSPNTPGLRDLQGRAALDELLARTLAARDAASERCGRIPLLLKIAPDLDLRSLDDVIDVARARRVDGMIVTNTTVSRPDGLRELAAAAQSGGLSGRPLFEHSTRMLAQSFLRTERQFPLVGAGGVEDGVTALAKIRAGATLLQLYTALVFKGPGLVGEIKRDVVAGLHGGRLADEIGRDAAGQAR